MPTARHRAGSTLSPLRLAVLAVAAIGVAVLVTAVGGCSGRSAETPPFSFAIGKAIGTSVDPEVKDRDLADRAAEIAAAVAPTLDDLYSAAFLDPANREDGAFEDVWALFDDEARPSAIEAATTLTTTGLGDRLDEVLPEDGTLSARVLFDLEGSPTLVAVRVTFRATAEPGLEGSDPAMLVSRGEYLLRPEGDGWVIVGFRVDREDENTPTPEVTP